MINTLINRFKTIRTNTFLNNVYDDKYAFVGIGNHSLQNLYPVIDYLQVPLKYIACTSEKKAQRINFKYKREIGISNLNTILKDNQVKGVFVSALPQAHYNIAKQVLNSKKALFIEKPVCQTSEQLNDLIKIQALQKQPVVVGMQKRYSPCVQKLKQRIKKDKLINYHLTYQVGLYVEGNSLYDLFIHPIDLVIYLFGNANILSCHRITKKGETLLITLQHKNVIGTLELSTDYSWRDARETLTINSYSGVYEMLNLDCLTFSSKQKSVLGIPIEKVWSKTQTKEYICSSNHFAPIMHNNQIVYQGFYTEILEFVNSVKNKTSTNIISNLQSLEHTYKILNDLS